MKTKLILLFTFLTLLSGNLIRGQDVIDTTGLLQAYIQQAEPAIMESLYEELSHQGTLNIERFGRTNDPFSQAMEQTFIKFALRNRGNVTLNLGYYEVDLSTPELAEEYYLQRTFEEHFPDRLLDFLEMKMLYEDPITLSNLRNINTHLLFDGIEEEFLKIRSTPPKITNRADVGLTKSSTFLNGTTLHDLRSTDDELTIDEDDCECNWWHCWLSCMDIEYDFLENVIWSTCTAVCPPDGLNAPSVGCLICVYTLIGAGSACAGQCSLDACSNGYKCTPGTPHPENDPECTTNGQISNFVCDCDGQGYHPESQDCPPGTICQGDGVCAPCDISGPIIHEPAPHDPRSRKDLKGLDDLEFIDQEEEEEVDEEGRALIGCYRTISLSDNTQNESAPGAQDGSISVSASGGYGGYTYRWDDHTTGSNRQGLSAGKYCVTVTDKRCCYVVKCFTLIEQACEGLSWEIVLADSPACNGDDGSVILQSVSSQNPPYTSTWSTGAEGEGIANLEVGYYTVTVTDAFGCTGVEGIHLTGTDGNQPDLSNSIVTNICPSSTTSGAINLVVESSSEIFSYSWNTGDYEQDIDNLSAGTYSVTVIDECGVEYSEDFEVTQVALAADVKHTIDNVCEGSITVTVEGGIPPVNFTIQGPGGTSSVTEENYNSYTFDDLCVGDYTITAQDANNCPLTTTQNVCVCPDIIYQDWVYEEEEGGPGQYCRYFSIPASPLCDAIDDVHCFVPIFGEWLLNPNTGQYCRSVTCPDDAYCEGFNINSQCFDPDYGPWTLNENLNQYCREVTCDDFLFCDGLQINECFGYEEGNCHLTSDNMCSCELVVNDEVIDNIISSPEVEWDYDEDNNECIKTYFCGTDFSETCEHEPEDDTGWEFDTSDQTCYRIVLCSDEDDIEYDLENDDPDITWEFDDWDEVCVAYIECDDYSDELEVEGDTELDWEFEPEDYICIATVLCGFDGDLQEEDQYVTDGGDADIVDIGVIGGDEVRCIITYDCGDGEVSGTTPGELAECGPNPDPNTNQFSPCLYTGCDGNSIVYDCLDQCDGLIAPDPEREEDIALEDIEEDNLEELISDIAVLVYPNPFQSELNINNLPIDKGPIMVEIIDGKGATLISTLSNGAESLTINTSKMVKGIYFIRMYSEDRSFTKMEKVVKAN